MKHRSLGFLFSLALAGSVPLHALGNEEKADGYAEWHHGDVLVVDGQQLRLAQGGKLKGQAEATDLASIPLGYEVKAKGTRQPGGVLLAREVEAKPNGSALFEEEVREVTDSAEAEYRKAGSFFEESESGRPQVIGKLYDSGPEVERVRGIVDTLVPPYLSPEDFRVYVIENEEWNAFAMGNYSVYVFSGLLRDMDDDEVAIVLGHEITHATHEHTRRQFKKQMWIQLAVLGVAGAAEAIDDKNKRAVVDLLAVFGGLAWRNGYGREMEDQADRVGLRYAYEAGYDITKGPRLWNRFAKKYGEPGKAANFFFGDHSLSSARAAKLERELTHNYADGPKAVGARSIAARSTPAAAASGSLAPAAASALAPTAASSGPGIKLGMTPEEVHKLLGRPKQEWVLGNRTKWIYEHQTVTFENGKVMEVGF